MAITEDLEEGRGFRIWGFAGFAREVEAGLNKAFIKNVPSRCFMLLVREVGYLAKSQLEGEDALTIARRCVRVAVYAGRLLLVTYGGDPGRFAAEVAAEALRACKKFPAPNLNTLALFEEVGEVADAIIHGSKQGSMQMECIQVAAMAARIAIEGDPSLNIR